MLIRQIAILLLSTLSLLWASDEQSDWFYRSWQTEDGLPDNSVSAIAQSSDGYLWIGTNAGVIRFNGSEFHPLPLRDRTDLPSQQVRAMIMDREGRLWLGMERGPIIRIEKKSHNLFKMQYDSPYKAMNHIVEDRDGQIWLPYSGGIHRIKNDTVTRFTKDLKIPLSQHQSIANDADGQLWLSSGSTLGRLDDDGFHLFKNFKDSPIRIASSRKSGLWLTHESALYFLKPDAAETHIIDLPEEARINSIFEDRLGAIWIGTQNHGLLRVFKKQLEKVPTSHPWITCIHEDLDGDLWAGTKGGGLNLISPRTARLIDLTAGLPFSSVRSTSCDSSGRIWATSLEGQLAFQENQENGQWQLYSDLPEGAFAQCVSVDSSDTVWIGTRKQGLFKIENAQLAPVASLAKGFVRSILPAKNGNLFVATSQPSKFHRLRNNEILTFQKPIEFGSIRALTESPDGTIWIGSSDGHLLRIEGDQLIDESAIDGPLNLSIRALHSTPDGSLWLGYAGDGLGHLKNGKYRRFTTVNGLHDDYISQIQHDDDDRLWIAANRGLFKVNLSHLLSESGHLYCQFYGRNNALPSIQPSRDFAPTSTRHQNGRLYFSTHRGLLEVTPDDPQDVSLPPPIVIEEITLNNEPVALFKNRSMLSGDSEIIDLSNPEPQLTLPPDHDNLVISFTALNFTAPDQTLIRYRLHPVDEKWQGVENQSRVTFPRLPPGDYKFQVIASNSNGIWSKDGASVDLIVNPFYWETWWFKLSIGILTALIAGGFVFLGLRKKHQLQLQTIAAREALEQERSRIARDIHDDLGATLTRITLLSQSPPPNADEPTQFAFDKIRSTTRELMSSMDGVVWAINPEHDTFDDLANYLSSFAQEFLSVAGISCRLFFPLELPDRRLSAQLRHNLLLAFKEALNNIVKYAEATEVRVSLEPKIESNSFILKINDNGVGIDPEAPSSPHRIHAGNGMANMEARMTEIGGECLFQSSPDQGTTVEFKIPFSATT